MSGVPEVRRLWTLICADGAGGSRLCLSAAEPSVEEVDASLGVLVCWGMLRDDGAHLTLPIVGALPRQPRYDLFTATSGADGLADVRFDPPFASPPKAVAAASPKVLVGPVKAEIVAGTLTGAGCKVKVTTAALTTGAVTALAGAVVTVTTIGA